MSIEAEVQSLKEEVRSLIAEVHVLQRQAGSRVGLTGARGDKGERGKDAHIRIVQADGKTFILELNDKPVAELVPIAGPAGRDGISPNVAELVEQTIAEIKRRIDKHLAAKYPESDKHMASKN
jgi:hypothetical protein